MDVALSSAGLYLGPVLVPAATPATAAPSVTGPTSAASDIGAPQHGATVNAASGAAAPGSPATPSSRRAHGGAGGGSGQRGGARGAGNEAAMMTGDAAEGGLWKSATMVCSWQQRGLCLWVYPCVRCGAEGIRKDREDEAYDGEGSHEGTSESGGRLKRCRVLLRISPLPLTHPSSSPHIHTPATRFSCFLHHASTQLAARRNCPLHPPASCALSLSTRPPSPLCPPSPPPPPPPRPQPLPRRCSCLAAALRTTPSPLTCRLRLAVSAGSTTTHRSPQALVATRDRGHP